jgi:hypothetical protein
MRAYWDEIGPPPHISLILIGQAIGVKFGLKERDEPIYGSIEPKFGLSIAELSAKIQPPRPGGDTLAASREVMRLMAAEGSA